MTFPILIMADEIDVDNPWTFMGYRLKSAITQNDQAYLVPELLSEHKA
jgi:hypothetical protein